MFVLPVKEHNKLHRLLQHVPLPPPQEINRLWAERRAMPYHIEPQEAFRWLLSSAEDIEFLKAISKQYVFLANNRLL